MDIELFDTTAPLTVANYLNYVTSPDTSGQPKYDGTFIYRNVPGFVLQTGGYTFRPPNPLVDALISPVLVKPVGLNTVAKGPLSPVKNEFKYSNLRGTIAMAKVPANFIDTNGNSCTQGTSGCSLQAGTGPDSATNEWFINLKDNTQLDTANGGFTVFGSIIDNGFDIANKISTFPIRPYAGAALRNNSFSNLPVVNYDVTALPLPAVLQKNLVMITSITQINRPILRFTPQNRTVPGDVNFGLDVAGDNLASTLDVLVNNTGNEQLSINTVNSSTTLPPFTITSENCSNKILDTVTTTPTASCSIKIAFSPVVPGNYSGSLLVSYTSVSTGISYTVTLHITGEGVPQTPVLTTSTASAQFPDTSYNKQSGDIFLTIRNKGGNPLTLSLMQITGVDSADFSISSNNCNTTTPLLIGKTCQLSVKFTPVSDGKKTALLSFQSNGGSIDIPLSGVATIPKISVNTSITLNGQIGKTRSKFLLITNTGTENLTITNATISGPDSSLFTQENNCPDTVNIPQGAQSLGPNGACRFLIKFTPKVVGIKNAILTLTSTDPNNASTDIALIGSGGDDTDGVPSNIEASSPNSGDGNNDGIADAIQNDVATFIASNSQYITFISDKSLKLKVKTALENVVLLNGIPKGIPPNASFNFGLFSYSIALPPGDGVNMALLLPPGQTPTAFYKFGPTAKNTTPHWYNFSFDPATGTGAKFIGNVTLLSPSGTGLKRNFVLISFIDGKRGDDDMIANGTILSTKSGPSFSKSITTSNSGSGALVYLPLLIAFIIKIFRPKGLRRSSS